jgi:hypothetical protein
MNKFKVSAFFLSLLVIFTTISGFIWLQKDTTPQRWDESIHLMAAYSFENALKSGPVNTIKRFITQESFYPPLVPFIAAFFGLSSSSEDNFTISMLLFICFIAVFTFLYTRRIFDDLSACVAASVVIAYPLIYSQAHYFMFDIPLTAFFMMSLYVLEKTDGFKNKLYSLLFGAICGLGMMVKWTFFIYALVPVLLNICGTVKNSVKGSAQKNNMLSAGVIFLVIGTPWYVYNSLSIISNILKYAVAQGRVEGLPVFMSLDSILFYIKMMPDMMTLLFMSLFIISLIFMAVDREKRKLALIFLVPFVIFILIPNKKDRYLMPILPVAAVISSYTVYLLRQRVNIRMFLAVVLIAAAFVQYGGATFGTAKKWPNSAQPAAVNWHINDFLSKVNPGSTLAIVPDSPYMNNLNYNFYALNSNKAVRIIGIYNFPMLTDYFLVKTGDLGPSFSGIDKRGVILRDSLDPKSQLSSMYEKVYEEKLPDGSDGMLFKRRENFAGASGSFRDDIDSNMMKLVSMYLKNAEKFKFDMSWGKNGIEEMNVSFKEGLMGDFKHKDAGLKVKNGSIVVRGLTPNPYALKEGKLQLISLSAVELKSFEVSEKDINDFISVYAKKVTQMAVNIDKGLINVSAVYSHIKFFISLEIYNPAPGTDNSDLRFLVKKVKAGPVSIPAGIVNFILKDYNPLLNRSNSPIKIRFGQITAEDGILKIR